MDVAETAGGYRDVLRGYLNMAVDRWQPRQAFAQAVTSAERPFHTYLE